MGLHINYELWLPGTESDATAAGLLDQLHRECQSSDGKRVGPMMHFSELDIVEGDQRYAPWTADRFAWAFAHGAIGIRDGQDRPSALRDSCSASMFFLYPGDGSEAAPFGLVRPSSRPGSPDAERADLQGRWYWYGCCKTQYASRLGEEHLIRCHRTVVHAIEAAIKLGFSVEVRDETGYWESRSTERLVSEVHRMNQIVARFAGAMHDAVGNAHSVESPIFSDPDFERLESDSHRSG